MDQKAQEFIQEKNIALVGVSRNPHKFGYTALLELVKRGYQVYPVHPSAEEINGIRCYPNLDAVKDKVSAIWICVKPDQGAAVLRDAASLGIKKVWIQQGAESPELEALGKELGLTLVLRKCVLMYAEPVGPLHGIHRFFVKLFGQY